MGFSHSHVQMWELDHKEGWAPKNWCSWTVVLEKTLESPLDCKEIKQGNPKGNQPWIVTGRTDLKLKLQYFGHLIWSADSLEKTLMLGKIHEFEQTLGANERQGSLACCSPWGCRVGPDLVTEEQHLPSQAHLMWFCSSVPFTQPCLVQLSGCGFCLPWLWAGTHLGFQYEFARWEC